MDVATALRQGTTILEKDSISAPRLTAEVLLARAIGCERVDLYAHPERELTSVEQVHFGRYLHERLQRKPTQYITGQQEFYGRVFRVTPAALIPRPETELVVETALRLAAGARRILDVGTGSGCLAVTLAKEMPGAVVWASDVSLKALGLAQENARRLEARVDFFCADLLEACGGLALDLIVSNPPYVPEEEMEGLPPEVRDYEPQAALYGGRGGSEFYGRL
ncbi:MAG: peptide chain release factor N(5)-glutamine methyltransferase, partial [Acidobacteria bacterium]|nr:peptide chain release factor N(5)-glutamine methyltransferase [Acidobacteriota bacterium]